MKFSCLYLNVDRVGVMRGVCVMWWQVCLDAVAL